MAAADRRAIRSRRLLQVAPTAIAVLWVAGIANFRDLPLGALEYGALFAAAIALQIVTTRSQRRQRPLQLPANSNPGTVAVIAAMLIGGVALLLGGITETAIPARPGQTLPPWPLRTAWHGACAFGAAYCRFLLRLSTASRRPPAAG